MKTSTKTMLKLAVLSLCLGATEIFGQVSMVANIVTQPCNNNGHISVSVTGLIPPISYTFSNWITNQNIVHANVNSTSDNLTGISAYQFQWGNANTWFIQASNGLGSASQTITLNPPFTDSVHVYNAVCPASPTLEVDNFIGGTAPFSCLWTKLSNQQTYNTNPAVVSSGVYSLVITDAAGCMVSVPGGSTSIFAFTQSGISVAITGTNANCTNGTALANATGGTAPYTYLWSNNAVTQSISGLSQGMYSCVATDAIGCQGQSSYYLPQVPVINYTPSITHATCTQLNGSVLSFVTGGTAPYTYLWSNAATTQNISGLAGGNLYQVQVTDANGCTAMGSAYVNVSTPINVTYSTIASSCTMATGSATVFPTGGTAPYSVLWYTFPTNSTGVSISNKAAGTYQFKVTDAAGCVRFGSVIIPPVSTINAILAHNQVVCPTNIVTIQASVNGSNPPFTYQWSNSATSAVISNVPIGSYNCVITDAVGCSVTRNANVHQLNPINVGFISTQATCIYANDGALQAIPTGGTAPYTYSWSNAQTGASISGLPSGTYFVSVTDANGCHNNTNNHAFVGYNAANNACYCTITGTVYADANSNCVKNSGENGIPNIQVHCSGLGYAYTNANGVYSFLAPSGTYTVSESVQMIYPLASCQSNNQVVTVTAAANCTSTVNFANNVVPIHDLKIISSSINMPVPGNPYMQKIIVQNDGTLTENNIRLAYTHDGQLAFNNSSAWSMVQPNATSYPNWYRINTGFPSLNPGSNSSSFMNYNVPTNIPVNTQVNFNDSVAHASPISTAWLTDNTPWNNLNQFPTVVVASYDPNFKEVSPKGKGAQGDITKSDSVLTYVVHFQNEGNYFAQNIVVVDSIDSDLQIESLRPGYSDHAYTTSISENGVVKFNFKNINLPWKSAYGDVLSSGMFTYAIKLKSNLAIGTQIKNKAAIYFDYNEPVITNTTLNTLVKPTSVNELAAVPDDNFSIYPNPANNNFNLIYRSKENTAAEVAVFDINGKQVLVANVNLKTGENTYLGNVSQLQNGIYLVQLKTANEKVSKKLVIRN